MFLLPRLNFIQEKKLNVDLIFFLFSFSPLFLISPWKICFLLFSIICFRFFRQMKSHFLGGKINIFSATSFLSTLCKIFSEKWRNHNSHRLKYQFMFRSLNFSIPKLKFWTILVLVLFNIKNCPRKIVPPSYKLFYADMYQRFLTVSGIFLSFFVWRLVFVSFCWNITFLNEEIIVFLESSEL